MRTRECLHLLIMGYTPEEVVRRMELTDTEAREIAIIVGSWMNDLQLDASYYASY